MGIALISTGLHIFTFRVALTCSIVLMTLAAPLSYASGYIDYDERRREVVAFVHGVTGDSKETWTNKSSKAYWPDLIRRDAQFSNANVWVFSYVSPLIENAQNIEELAIKLGDEMRADGVLEKHDRLFIIAHSMGGIIVREMLALKLPRPEKIPLLYFFGTPSQGANLAGIGAAISSNPQFANMKPFTRESAVASFARKWLATAELPAAKYPQRIFSFCAYEIDGVVGNALIVSELSASFLCSTVPRASKANHISMVKPKDREDEPYKYFLSAYNFARSDTAQILAYSGSIVLATQANKPLDPEKLRLRTEQLSRQYFEVDCDQRRRETLPIPVTLTPQQRIVAAQAIVNSTSNLSSSSFKAFVAQDGKPTLRYDIRGLQRVLFNCPGGGNAHVTIKYVIEE